MDEFRPSGFLLSLTQEDMFSNNYDVYLPNEVISIT